MLKKSSLLRKDIYKFEKTLIFVTTDKISACNQLFPTTVESKGVVINQLSAFWFDFAKNLLHNHMITANHLEMHNSFHNDYFAGRSMLVRKLKMLPVECTVRSHLYGSAWANYHSQGLVAGIKLPQDLQLAEKLPEPIFTPMIKTGKYSGQNVTFDQMRSTIGDGISKVMRNVCLELYSLAAEYALNRGLILADAKFEFGYNERGVLHLADELLTPDCSRYWSLEHYAVGKAQLSVLKQDLLKWLMKSGWKTGTPAPDIPKEILATTSQNYKNFYKQLTGKDL